MAKVSAAQLRRALQQLLTETRHGAGGGADLGFGVGSGVGAAGGAALGAQYETEDGHSMMMPGMVGGAMGAGMAGAGVGALLGGGRGLARSMGSFRRALAEKLEEPRMTNFPRRDFTPEQIERLGEPGPIYGRADHPLSGGRANPVDEMNELQAMRNKLRELRRERRYAQTQEDADEIDLEIEAIQRTLRYAAGE